MPKPSKVAAARGLVRYHPEPDLDAIALSLEQGLQIIIGQCTACGKLVEGSRQRLPQATPSQPGRHAKLAMTVARAGTREIPTRADGPASSAR